MKKDSLEKKIAAYVTLAAAYLAAHPVDADAQIMYTDVNPDLLFQNSYFNLDLNNDGVVDFKLQHFEQTGSFSSSSYWIHKQNIIQCFGQNEVVKVVSTYWSTFDDPIPIPPCESVGVNNSFTQSFILNTYMHSYDSSGSNTFWDGNFWGMNKIVGVKIVNAGVVNYGWVRLDFFTDGDMRLKDFAIELTPDSSIGGSTILSAISDSICVFNTGTIDLIVENNAGVYTYDWNTGDSTENLNGLNGGIYSVTVTSGMGCSASLNIPLFNIVPPPTITISNQILYSSYSGKNQWYLDSIGNPLTGDTLENLTPFNNGYYLVEAIYPNGCSNISDSVYVGFVIGIKNTDIPFVSIIVDNKKLIFHLTDNSLLGNQIEIINELGQLVTTVTVTNQTPEADLSALPSGIYFFHIRSKQKTLSGKFFIE